MNVIIVGGGQVGGYIAGLLIENGNNAIVIENKEKALQALKKNGLKKENVLTGDGTDALSLEKPECADVTPWFVLRAMMKLIWPWQ